MTDATALVSIGLVGAAIAVSVTRFEHGPGAALRRWVLGGAEVAGTVKGGEDLPRVRAGLPRWSVRLVMCPQCLAVWTGTAAGLVAWALGAGPGALAGGAWAWGVVAVLAAVGGRSTAAR